MRNGLDPCWNRIGVSGDASCPRLAEVGHCRNCDEYARAGRALLDREVPAGVREGWSSLLAEINPSITTGGESVVVFEVRGEYLALRTLLVECVTWVRPVHTVPSRSGAVFTGLVAIDGELVPCFCAAAALQLGEEGLASNPGRLLILHEGGRRVACAVDQVVGLVRLSAEDLQAPPVTLAGDDRAFTTAVFAVKNKHAGLLDGPKFIQRLLRTASV